METSDQDIRRPSSLPPACLLLLLGEREGHGYDLVERLGCFGFDWSGKPGPTYSELRKLEEAGLVASAWDMGERGPARRVYRLTQAAAGPWTSRRGTWRRSPSWPISTAGATQAWRRRRPQPPPAGHGTGEPAQRRGSRNLWGDLGLQGRVQTGRAQPPPVQAVQAGSVGWLPAAVAVGVVVGAGQRGRLDGHLGHVVELAQGPPQPPLAPLPAQRFKALALGCAGRAGPGPGRHELPFGIARYPAPEHMLTRSRPARRGRPPGGCRRRRPRPASARRRPRPDHRCRPQRS